MRRVDAVFHGALVVDVPFEILAGGSPSLHSPFGNFKNRRPFRLVEVAQETENQSVAFHDRIGVHPRPAGRLCLHADGRHARALPLAVESPAVVRTLHATVFHHAVAERTAAVAAGIAEAVGLAVLVAPQHEVLAQHAPLERLVLQFPGFDRGVPEIDEHCFPAGCRGGNTPTPRVRRPGRSPRPVRGLPASAVPGRSPSPSSCAVPGSGWRTPCAAHAREPCPDRFASRALPIP